jgi:hypothetical protein
MEYIRQKYNVPAKRGGYVLLKWLGIRARILSAQNGSLYVKTTRGHRIKIHPTWSVEYL